MIRIFGQTDKVFTSNGDYVLTPLKAKLHKADNGDYYIDIETGLDCVDYLAEGNVLVADTPQGVQSFRIGNVTKTKTKLSTRAWQTFYDSENYVIADSYVVSKNCGDALAHLNSATEPQSPFTVGSDIETVDSYRCVRKSLYEAFMDVLERWGGHLVRDKFSVEIVSDIGTDNGITVEYKKNLKDITCSEVWDNVVTKILPVGKDGILLNAVVPTASIYITSAVQYAIPYTKAVQFDQSDIKEADYQDETAYKTALVNDLRSQASQYLADNSIPQVNYTLKANLEKITDIGDIVHVKDSRLGINLTTRVISFDYDCILGKYTEVEFGNFKRSIDGLMATLKSDARQIATETAQGAESSIIDMMNRSYVVYDGNKIYVLDQLPEESAQNVIKITNQGIGFSQSGISGQSTSVWSIDGKLTLSEVLTLLNGATVTGTVNVNGGVSANSVTIGGAEINDFITDSGTTGGWEWRKLNGHAVEAWTQATADSTQLTWSAVTTDIEKATFSMAIPFSMSNMIIVATVNDGADAWISKAVANGNSIDIDIMRCGATTDIKIGIYVKATYQEA